MKKIYINKLNLITIITILILILTSCQTVKPSNKKLIVTTLYPEYEMVNTILSSDQRLLDYYDVTLLMPYGCDIHSYDPSMSDLLTIKKAYAFIYTADEMEKWVAKLDFSESTHVLNLSTDERIVLLETEESEEEHHHEEEEEHNHKGHVHTYDPHLWTYPKYVEYMIEDICNLLLEITPDPYDLLSNIMKANAEAYIKEFELIDEAIKQVVESTSNKTIYFGCPFSFYYWSVYYDISYELTYLTCSTEVEPSLIDVMEIVEKMKENNIKTIYAKELLSTQAADTIALYTDAEVVLLHSGHNISSQQVGLDEYKFVNIMKQNVYNLAIGLEVDTNKITDFALEREEVK